MHVPLPDLMTIVGVFLSAHFSTCVSAYHLQSDCHGRTSIGLGLQLVSQPADDPGPLGQPSLDKVPATALFTLALFKLPPLGQNLEIFSAVLLSFFVPMRTEDQCPVNLRLCRPLSSLLSS